MSKRFLILVLMMTLIPSSLLLETAGAQSGANNELTAKWRAKVAKIGVGVNAKVEVKLRDQSRIKGYISELDSNSFTVIERETGSGRAIAYDEVAEIKKPRGGLSTKSWIIIGAAAAGAIVTWNLVKPAVCDGGAQSRGIC